MKGYILERDHFNATAARNLLTILITLKNTKSVIQRMIYNHNILPQRAPQVAAETPYSS